MPQENQENKAKKKTSIGGQALIEGVMMRGPQKTAMAVRHVSGEIVMEEFSNGISKGMKAVRKIPLVRGVVNMVESMVLGYRCLMRSAEMAGLEEEEESGKEEKPQSKAEAFFISLLMVLSTVVGIVLAIVLFIFLPAFLYGLITKAVPSMENRLWRSIFEGLIRIVLFVAYMLLVSLMKDIRRVFRYHGAEHKTIFCYEAGEELTVENVRKQGRFHPRCGTSFMFVLIIIATIVSSIVFSIIDITNPFLRMLAHLILLPLVVGISYEFNRYAGRSESVISRALRWPGLMIQHLTVFEPDDSMIEVAITAMKEVIPDDGSDEW